MSVYTLKNLNDRKYVLELPLLQIYCGKYGMKIANVEKILVARHYCLQTVSSFFQPLHVLPSIFQSQYKTALTSSRSCMVSARMKDYKF